MDQLSFSELQIQGLFGHEAAEDEDPQRLREYYFKTSTYDQVVTDLPLRILVGHKGIGKSALFQVAMREETDAHRLTILVKPDDIAGLATDTSDFLATIRNWKDGLLEILAKKILNSFGMESTDVPARLKRLGGNLVDILRETFSKAVQVEQTPAKKLLVDHFLKTGKITVYIDDLDRGWQGRRTDVQRISALLNAVRDMAREDRGLHFRISLRSDVYYLVRTSDESTDKIEGSVVWQAWTNHEIFVVLVKRLETFFGRSVDERLLLRTPQSQLARYLNLVFEKRFSGLGHWAKAPMYRVLMSLIRRRPRDLIKLCTLAARNAQQERSTQITTQNLTAIFEEYSQGRVQDTINEFRSELPDIERLLTNMKPSRRERTAKEGYVYTTAGLLSKISNAMQTGEFRFATGRVASTKDLAAFMYKINFLTARKETPNGIVRKYFEENRYLSSDFADFGFDWEIHPAYRWALQPDDPRAIYQSLQLSADES
ncbi:MAG TPA: hypothetical protein VNO43_07610 [Candidatus Eisenbacteria bacterium]|nr:hypothetical protein [Candidatus Eisenbacteria bacterium]